MVRTLLLSAATLVAINIIFLAGLVPASVYESLPDVANYNEITLERAARHPERWTTAIVGSSAVTNIPPPGSAPSDVVTIAIQGGSAVTGLAALVRSSATPRVVFVEADFAARGEDKALLDKEFSAKKSWIRSWFPMFLSENNPLSLVRRLAARDFYDPGAWRSDEDPNWQTAKASIEEHARSYLAFTQTPIAASDPRFTGSIELIRTYLGILSGRGARIFFFTLPLAPSLRDDPSITSAAIMRETFPDYQWVAFKAEDYTTMDGMHPTRWAGWRIYEKLMEAAEAQ